MSELENNDFMVVIPNEGEPKETKCTVSAKENNTIESKSQYDLPLSRCEWYDTKKLKSFIYSVERLTRGTPEYKEWVNYVKFDLENNKCVLTDENTDDVTIHIHHHPVDLYTLIKTIINNKISNEIEYTSVDIIDEVLKLHYTNCIGYTALCTTMHEKFHHGAEDIPIDLCHGNYRELLKKYDFEDEDVKKINIYMNIKNKNKKTWTK